MKTFKRHLDNKLKNDKFNELYNEEKKLIALSMKIHEQREKIGLTQKQAAERAKVTQQQLSKIENGINCNIITFIKVCEALGLEFHFNNTIKKHRAHL